MRLSHYAICNLQIHPRTDHFSVFDNLSVLRQEYLQSTVGWFFVPIKPTIDAEAWSLTKLALVVPSRNSQIVSISHIEDGETLAIPDDGDTVDHDTASVPISDRQNGAAGATVPQNEELGVSIAYSELSLAACFTNLRSNIWQGEKCTNKGCPATERTNPLSDAILFTSDAPRGIEKCEMRSVQEREAAQKGGDGYRSNIGCFRTPHGAGNTTFRRGLTRGRLASRFQRRNVSRQFRVKLGAITTRMSPPVASLKEVPA
ncbi:hypothetical protein OHD62_17395 [Mesorhizobium sp. YC-39]|uniref:hypothetical protein n=1 Tax=unclassified Mesorhizobium TaxID=325217 RepID=UPI0021E9540C|nr:MULTISPECIES: hypothetical protein [unclassified Mesorhizobium]MCV3209619.1 hypothetical protein [Mesorhizobium sp. YC-2]MCV3230149.1 hypothetical protein [Mesorhizobium sp. YC-39]